MMEKFARGVVDLCIRPYHLLVSNRIVVLLCCFGMMVGFSYFTPFHHRHAHTHTSWGNREKLWCGERVEKSKW